MRIEDNKIDTERMNSLVEHKLIARKVRTEGLRHLYLFNYTQKCVFEKVWDDYTMMARGLVTTADGTIIARPFPKFFNVEEWQEGVPQGKIELFEKVDGSMITATYNVHDGLVVATRGSFDSDQAQHARELILNKYGTDWMSHGLTYVFEVIYPENRIVVNYGKRDELVLLGVRSNRGYDIPHDTLRTINYPFTLAKRVFVYDSWDTLLNDNPKHKLINPNEEGFVLRFEDNFRLKLKGDEYLRLHRIVTNTNNKTVWEMCKSGASFEYLIANVPDEFMWWVKEVRNEFVRDYDDLEQIHLEVFEVLKERPRPQFAAGVSDFVRSGFYGREINSAVLFRLKDGKSYGTMLWDMLRPTELIRPPVGMEGTIEA